jgi:DNA-binding response OmpR family regulator
MGQTAKILVIDDDEVIRETLAMVLENEGYSVDKAKNGQEATAKSFENSYNIAIVDWRLPDIDGTQLLDKLKQTTPKMAKIMLTGYPSMNNAVEAVNNRADAFLVKPVDIGVLLKKVSALLKEQEQARIYSEEKVAEFIETRSKEIMMNNNGKQTKES